MKPDYNLTDEERQERYQRALQRRLALCGSRTYPSVYARDEINALLQGDMDTEADEPHHHLEGIVDISDTECLCPKSNWHSLACPIHGIDTWKSRQNVDISDKE